MKYKITIGIDPGANGGIAWIADGKACVEKMPWLVAISRKKTWPNDPEPFESQDHDNDSEIYKEEP